MEDFTTKKERFSPFRHPRHPYIEQFLMSADNLIQHRLRVAIVVANTDRLSFRHDLEDIKLIEDAIQEELDFPDEFTFYASLGVFSPSELLNKHWNTEDGIRRMVDGLYRVFRSI